MSIRNAVKSIIPFSLLTAYRASVERRRTGRSTAGSAESVFERIHETNAWGSEESVSGPGSEEKETEDVRALLPHLIRRLGIKSILDVPCGDFAWMRLVDLGECRYIGADIVASLIERNRAVYGSANRAFIHADVARDPLPHADLILCRDCLIHLSFDDALAAIANFKKSGATYLLATTNPSVEENRPIVTGGFRNLNLQRKPFNFPRPLELHSDRYTPPLGTTMLDPWKSLGLWKLADL